MCYWAQVSSGPSVRTAILDDLDLPDAELTYCWKTLFDTLAVLRSIENMPLLVCLEKLVARFAGCDTGDLLTAQANVFTSPGLRAWLVHLLQPEHKTSTVQCVEFLEELSVV